MSRLSSEQILSKIYYDLERGYGNARSLYEQAKEEGAVITLEEVSYLVPTARTEFQIDIMDTNKFKQGGEERYGLIVIDAFSRFAYIHPMENKNSEDVLKASKTIIQSSGGTHGNI